mmetsp:Transcript_5347/g.12271  ORF Transcript_5347/g.12271 Transcript_5347/m.12271 type:complete len:201 (+) Transcript_5347:76-678(+)
MICRSCSAIAATEASFPGHCAHKPLGKVQTVHPCSKPKRDASSARASTTILLRSPRTPMEAGSNRVSAFSSSTAIHFSALTPFWFCFAGSSPRAAAMQVAIHRRKLPAASSSFLLEVVGTCGSCPNSRRCSRQSVQRSKVSQHTGHAKRLRLRAATESLVALAGCGASLRRISIRVPRRKRARKRADGASSSSSISTWSR